MASIDYRLNPLFSIKECMSCGALYTRNCSCSTGSLKDKILVPVPDSSQQPPQNCATCGNPVDGLYCRHCAFVRKCLNEGWYTIHDENAILNTSKTSKNNTNVKEEEKRIMEDQAAKDRYWKIPIYYDDDEDYTIAITPVLSTKELVDSLIMEDEHLDTILAMESDEIIKSSAENLVPIPSESEGLSNNICDVPSYGNDHFDVESLLSLDIPITSPKINFLSEEFAGELAPILPDIHKADFDEEEDIFDGDTLSDDEDFEDIEYIDASPPNSELVSLEEVEDVILRDKLSNVYLIISKIESLNDNPTLSSFSYSDNSFSNHLEETRSGSTTSHADISLSKYDSFYFENEPDQGDLFGVMENNDDSISFPEYESFHFDLYDDPSFPRPLPEPPDVKIRLEPDTAMKNNEDFNQGEIVLP
ncbi:hypothetical protein Tco_1443216, partial [Tanacetum coccineum]